MGGAKCPSNNRINERIVLITGGSTGLGLETAKELAMRGYYKYMKKRINYIIYFRCTNNINLQKCNKRKKCIK